MSGEQAEVDFKTRVCALTEDIAESALSGEITGAIFITVGKAGLEVTPVGMKWPEAVGSCQISLNILISKAMR
jgi:hypothetical protein